MRSTDLGNDTDSENFADLDQAIRDYEARDEAQTEVWLHIFR